MTAIVDHTHHFSRTDQLIYWLGKHWLVVVSILLGVYVIVPFLAPVFMAAGWIIPGKAIYWIYSFLCHQLPERSYFFFGPKISYSIPEIESAWKNTNNIAILRQFIGNTQMGWKVAWSDRMVSMYTSTWLFGMLWGKIKKIIKRLPWWGLVLFLLPMAIDGTSHFFSDLAGIGQGFRAANTWLVLLTHNAFPATFYAGDALGSFNAWMRIITGILFGIGIVWYGFPYLEEAFTNSVEVVEYKYQYRAWLKLEKVRLAHLAAIASSSPDGADGVVLTGLKGENDDSHSPAHSTFQR